MIHKFLWIEDSHKTDGEHLIPEKEIHHLIHGAWLSMVGTRFS